jgi:hypothetical protein
MIMADTNLRVYPVDGDGYGEPIEYPAGVGYRTEPIKPGATGDANHDLVVYDKRDLDSDDRPKELGRHRMTEVLVVYPGQPSPVTATSTDTSSPKAKSTKTSTPQDKAGTPAK